MKKYREYIIYLSIIIGIILFRIFIATPVVVDGSSMSPTLTNGDIMILYKLDHTYNRGDIVVLNYKNEELIKRIIGSPGETVKYQNGILYVNGIEVGDTKSSITADFNIESLGYDKIPDNYYLVLGDNRTNSLDSRYIGLINKDNIIGKATIRLYPFDKIGSVE